VGNHHKNNSMKKSLSIQTKLLEAGFKYLRLCDFESTSPEIKHYKLEKELGDDADFCIINTYTEISTEIGLSILENYLNPTIIYPNPLEI
jgi:hypothetical protein